MSSLLLRSGLERGEEVCMYVCVVWRFVRKAGGGGGGRSVYVRVSLLYLYVCIFLVVVVVGEVGSLFFGGGGLVLLYTHTHTQRNTTQSSSIYPPALSVSTKPPEIPAKKNYLSFSIHSKTPILKKKEPPHIYQSEPFPSLPLSSSPPIK